MTDEDFEDTEELNLTSQDKPDEIVKGEIVIVLLDQMKCEVG
jgi:hypothetical protein